MRKKVRDFFRKGTILPPVLLASLFVGFFTTLTILAIPSLSEPDANMRIYPTQKILSPNETFEVRIIVDSTIPVNVFGGELHFNHDILNVESIDYNTSIADLWAEKPWYENGAGTINFGGGTTRRGGFTGSETLMTITFKTRGEGAGSLTLHDARILQHDGLGTEASLPTPIDALFTIQSTSTPETQVLRQTPVSTSYTVVTNPPSTDLNTDGKQTLADLSIFMLNFASNDPRFDFNLDGKVNTTDLGIILSAP